MPTTRTTIIAVLLVAVVAAGAGVYYFFPSPSTDEEPDGTEGVTLTILTRHDSSIWSIYEPAFLETEAAQELNVNDIKWLQPDPGLWIATVNSDDVTVDLAWGGGPTLFDELSRAGLLQPLTSDEMTQLRETIPPMIAGAPTWRTNDADEMVWMGAAISTFGFTINEEFLEANDLPTPETWTDLAQPVYGKILPSESAISMTNSPDSTSNTRIYEIILQAFGWEQGWTVLTRMSANARILFGSVTTQQAVENNQVGVAMSIDFYGYTSQLINPDTRYVLPEGQSIVNADPIALVNETQNAEAARAFISYVLSQEGQSLWLQEEVNRMPIREDAFDTEIGQERSDLKEVYESTIESSAIEFSDQLAISYENSLQHYFEATLTEAHDDLVATWQAMVESYLPELCGQNCLTDQEFQTLAQRLGEPITFTDPETGEEVTFTQSYAQEINEDMRNPEFQNQMKSVWREAAIQKYTEVREMLQEMLG